MCLIGELENLIWLENYLITERNEKFNEWANRYPIEI